MAASNNVCKYLDMPLQHASPTVLQRMRRPLQPKALQSLLDTIRDKVPGIALRTTFIVGFPGETEADFEQLLAFVEQQRFARVGAFTYSHEEGTVAYTRYADDVPAPVKKKRYERLMALQQRISLARNQALVDQRLPVLIESQQGASYIGRSPYDSPDIDNQVWVTSQQPLPIGALTEVQVARAGAYDLYAKACVS